MFRKIRSHSFTWDKLRFTISKIQDHAIDIQAYVKIENNDLLLEGENIKVLFNRKEKGSSFKLETTIKKEEFEKLIYNTYQPTETLNILKTIKKEVTNANNVEYNGLARSTGVRQCEKCYHFNEHRNIVNI